MPLVVIPVPKHTWDMNPSHRPSGLESLELARGVNDYGTLTHTLFEPRDHAIHVFGDAPETPFVMRLKGHDAFLESRSPMCKVASQRRPGTAGMLYTSRLIGPHILGS